jgi:hypothetical protein
MERLIKYKTVSSDTLKINKHQIIQHVIIRDDRGLSRCLCNKETDSKVSGRFAGFNSETIDESILCSRCAALSSKLINRESEVQRFYDITLKEISSLDEEISKIESNLKKLKLKRIKAQSDISKAKMRAKELGVYNFL